MALLSLNNIKKSYGVDDILENVTFTVNNNDKIGLIGPNGAGKTTLFKMITGDILPDEGDITISKQLKIGYVEQHTLAIETEHTLWEEIHSCFAHLIKMENRIEELTHELNQVDEGHLELANKLSDLNAEFERLGGFGYKNRVRATLLGLGFQEEDFHKKVRVLSGGQGTRIALGKVLLEEHDLLMLDEPTNNLDITSCEWLEDVLKNYKGAVIVISHDRYFLDAVTNITVGIENGKSVVYRGNYSYYITQRELDKESLQRRYVNYQREVNRLEGIIEQQRRWNRERNIKAAESKQKQIGRMEIPDAPEQETRTIHFKFTPRENCGNDVLIANDLSKSFSTKLFSDVDFFIKKGERVFLLGDNGIGKTTLFKILLDEEHADSGEIKLGANVHPGYYSQKRTDLDPNSTIIDEVWSANPRMTQTDIRNALAAFAFTEDDVFKRIDNISGGEAGRVALVKLMLSKANFLLLDEPTNHLDISSKEALEQAILNYEGTVFIISHDRYFINKVATRIYCLERNKMSNYIGNYDYFISKFKKAVSEKEQSEKKSSNKNEYQRKKEYESEIRKLKGQISRKEESIGQLEEGINKLEETLAQPEIAVDYMKVVELTEKLNNFKNELDAEYDVWTLLTEELNEKELL